MMAAVLIDLIRLTNKTDVLEYLAAHRAPG